MGLLEPPCRPDRPGRVQALKQLSLTRAVAIAAVLCALAVGCARTDHEPAVRAEPSSIVEDGEGYTFRRVTSKGTEVLIERGFGKDAFDEVISVIARRGSEPVGPVDVMVLDRPISPDEWVKEFYPGLERRDVSTEVGADGILFIGSAIGVVMDCASNEDILIRGAATGRRSLIDLMQFLSFRCGSFRM